MHPCALSLTLGVLTAVAAAEPRGDVLKATILPGGIAELTGLKFRTLVELKDGSLLCPEGRRSTDGGRTWGPPRKFIAKGIRLSRVGTRSFVRLNSGALAMVNRGVDDASRGACLWISNDEGKTWSDPRPIRLFGSPYHDTMVQLRSGRLLFPSRMGFWNRAHPDLKGRGHTRMPEMSVTRVSYSDDLGKTWQFNRGDLMGWFDARGVPDGAPHVSACDEPCLAETADGRVLLFARSHVGRIVSTYSRDGGTTWTLLRPTQLAGSIAPCRLRQIPKTSDLLCVWNQVSVEEIERGDWRSRLSSAISKDSGATWEHFRTLWAADGMDKVDRIPPELPIRWRRVDDRKGKRSRAEYLYPNVRFAGDKVYVFYKRRFYPKRKKRTQDVAMRIYPLTWFYGQ